MESTDFLGLTADIVSAHVSNNEIDSSDVGRLVQSGIGLGLLGTRHIKRD